jgi:hypothetical protein
MEHVMAPIQCRPEVNALTVPQSYKITYVSSGSIGTDGLAAAMVQENPNYTEEEARMMLATLKNVIRKSLLDGKQTTIDGLVTFGLSFTGRLNGPDDPLPPVEEMLQVNVHVLAPFLKEIRQQAQIERLARNKKVPLLNTAEDTLLKLNNVLNPDGVLRITGEDLLFDAEQGTGECVIAGTQSGRTVQTRLNLVSNSAIMLMPEIPLQAHPWNNEYLLSVTTRYTAHGTPRTGIYEQRLRSVIMVNGLLHPEGLGMLSSSETEQAYVTLTSGAASASEMVRIQAVFDNRDSVLLINLISMKEDGPVGEVMTVTANGSGTLQGFAGSAVSNITINIADYLALTELVRDYYYNRLVDVLDVRIS